MQVTKIYNSFNNLTENKCNRPTFGYAKLKHLYTKDFFVKSDLKLASLSEIKDIAPVAFAGTKCRGAIMLKDFWDTIAPKNLKKKFILSRQGLSTNKNGFADSFLKTQAHKPISTSFVHDCAVMYLYNDKTKTHAMYHAAPSTKVKRLNFFIKTLMPEGFTHASIVPGDYSFYKEQEPNMKNMFKLLKQNNPSSVVNVFYGINRFPEIVGYKGQVFQIPNKKVEEQEKVTLDVIDNGQASFKIIDAGGYNTFDYIYGECSTPEELDDLKNRFKKDKFPKLMFEIFAKEIDKQKEVLKIIDSSKSLEELNDWNTVFSENKFKTIFHKKRENMLIQMLEKVQDKESLKNFYQTARFDFIHMKKLFKLFQEKKKEIL